MGLCVLCAGPPDLPLPNDAPVGDRPMLEGSELDGGLRLVAVPLGTRFPRPLSAKRVLIAVLMGTRHRGCRPARRRGGRDQLLHLAAAGLHAGGNVKCSFSS